MDFDDENRISFKTHYQLDDQTHQQLTELMQRARTTTNKDQASSLLDWADSLAYRYYCANRDGR